MKLLSCLLLVTMFIFAGAAAVAANSSSRQKKYAGAYDEHDLQVQEELPVPKQKFDQHTQELKVRNNLFKKDEKDETTKR